MALLLSKPKKILSKTTSVQQPQFCLFPSQNSWKPLEIHQCFLIFFKKQTKPNQPFAAVRCEVPRPREAPSVAARGSSACRSRPSRRLQRPVPHSWAKPAGRRRPDVCFWFFGAVEGLFFAGVKSRIFLVFSRSSYIIAVDWSFSRVYQRLLRVSRRSACVSVIVHSQGHWLKPSMKPSVLLSLPPPCRSVLGALLMVTRRALRLKCKWRKKYQSKFYTVLTSCKFLHLQFQRIKNLQQIQSSTPELLLVFSTSHIS